MGGINRNQGLAMRRTSSEEQEVCGEIEAQPQDSGTGCCVFFPILTQIVESLIGFLAILQSGRVNI